MDLPEPVDLPTLLADPIGPWWGSSGVVFWWARPDVRLLAFFGAPDDRDVDGLIAAMRAQLAPGVAAHRSYVDARQVTRVDPAPFGRFAAFMAETREDFAARIPASAIVADGPFVAAISAGYQRVAGVAFPSSVHATPASAAVWLDLHDGEALIAGLEARVAWMRTGGDLTTRLRRRLAADPRVADLAAHAAGLGVSTRTLQRTLQERGTTFQGELLAARIARAKALLQDPAHKVLTVALEVGFEKEQSFAEAFRRVEGVTPTAWRRAQGPSGG